MEDFLMAANDNCINALYLYDKLYRNNIFVSSRLSATNNYNINIINPKNIVKRDHIEFIHFDESVLKNYF